MSASQSDIIYTQAAHLLGLAAIRAEIKDLSLSKVGGNNRLYRLDTTAGCFAVKQYFRHQGDERDRLGAEYAFLSYAHSVAPGMVPQPLAQDRTAGMALYEFIVGEPLRPGEVGKAEVDAAIAFFSTLNDNKAHHAVSGIGNASEACFSIAGHLDLIGRRIGQLLDVAPEKEVDHRGRAFILRLDEAWRQVRNRIREAAAQLDWDVNEVLPLEQRCISPSDFGFHNALKGTDDKLHFLDFEYAGWDDPAKTAGDFFAQLAVPVPTKYFDRFVEAIVQPFVRPEELVLRAQLVRPVYLFKWCCIALNIFLPVHLARRRFANPKLDELALKEMQIVKAEEILYYIQEANHGLH